MYWWMIKIYNPEKKDRLDVGFRDWAGFQALVPNAYVDATAPDPAPDPAAHRPFVAFSGEGRHIGEGRHF
jgi:hypothetical protein